MSRLPVLLLVLLPVVAACGESSGEPAERTPETTTLRVVCLNVWAVPLAAKDLDLRFRRLLPALRSLEPDLLCLQEVFLDATRSRIADGLGPDWTCTEGTAGGLLIASRHRIESSAFTAYPVHPDLRLAERLARKGFLEAVVATPAGLLRVVTTHLAAEWSQDGARQQQQDVLLAAVAARTELPLLLAGDLNTAVVSAAGPTPAWQDLAGLGFEHAEPPRRRPDGQWAAATPTRVGWPRDRTRFGWSPDHVLMRGSAAVSGDLVSYSVELDTPETAVSDHNLLLATVRLAPR